MIHTNRAWPLAACALLATATATATACVKAPAISVVDNKTALEAQAAGEFHSLENDLSQASVSPGAEPIPREDLAATSGLENDNELGEVAQLYASANTDADWIDSMLKAGCIGEALSGLLEPTPEQCKAELDTNQLTRILGRTNLHRRQAWQLLAARNPGTSEQAVRDTWRRLYLQRVVCGALIQIDANTWEPKKC